LKLRTIEDVAFNLISDAAIFLPEDVKQHLKMAHKRESDKTAKGQLEAILDNIELAEKQQVPFCQDTGTVTFYARIGPQVGNIAGIEAALTNATRKATSEVPLRPNAVDPFSELNSGDNTGRFVPKVHWEPSRGEGLELTVMLKGGGSENATALGMLNPNEGVKGLKRFVIDSVIRAGAQPCPPTILGIATGGGADVALELAKKTLFRPLGTSAQEPQIAKLEKELLEAINMTGIGPMGLGGDTTALTVHVDYAHRHPASFPVAVVFSCWADRHASVQISDNGQVKYSSRRAPEWPTHDNTQAKDTNF
jgi:fumarate hydratase subunit alpha